MSSELLESLWTMGALNEMCHLAGRMEGMQIWQLRWTILTVCPRLLRTVLTSMYLSSVAMAQRVTLRKRNPYNTTSNRRRMVKTPGGKLVYHHIKKLATSPKCGDCGIALPGVRISRSSAPSAPCLTFHSERTYVLTFD